MRAQSRRSSACSAAISRLQEVGPVAAHAPRALERGAAGLDLRAVPQRAILVGEQHELAVAKARVAARVVQQHQREQPERLGLVGHQLGERDTEPDRLRRRARRGRRSPR